MTPAMRQYLVNELIRGVMTIGKDFETFGRTLVNYLSKVPMQHRGLTTEGQPVGHTVDSVSADGKVVAEYSSEADYFESPFKKIWKDVRHARNLHPQVECLFLLSSRERGPKAATRLTNLTRRLGRFANLSVEFFDARRIAEAITDDLLLNDRAVDELAEFIGPLGKLRDEYAITHLLPQISITYRPRPDLQVTIQTRLLADRVVGLAGISGSGKSETAAAVAQGLVDTFDMVAWVPASGITSATDLHAVDVERRGRRVNLLHLLRNRRCLVVLDDLRAPLGAAEIGPHCGGTSAVLITRQSAYDRDIVMPPLERSDAQSLLQDGVPVTCPDDVFDAIWSVVGGHPLTLKLMNAGARSGTTWDELREDCAAVGYYADEDRTRRLADRLLERLERVCEKELAFFEWCGLSRVDRSFARTALSQSGIRKLQDACLLAPDRRDVVRLHDIVMATLPVIQLPVGRFSNEFDRALDAHVEGLAFRAASDLAFLNLCQLHRDQFERILAATPGRDACMYCLLHAWIDQEIDPSMIGDLMARARGLAAMRFPPDIAIITVLELVEGLYRRAKLDNGIADARTLLESLIPVFVTLEDANGVSEDAKLRVFHHHAKAFKNLERYAEAIAICEKVLTQRRLPATRLLLARLLMFEEPSREKAKDLLFELLRDAKATPEQAEISVTLAAITAIGQWQLKAWFRDALVEFGELAANYIVDAAARGFDQAFVAFAAIGRELQFNDDALFQKVISQLPQRSVEDIRDDKERAAWGDILLTAAKAAEGAARDALLHKALECYEALSQPAAYNKQQMGQVLVLLGRFDNAVRVLDPLVEIGPNPWNRYWLSKALLALRQTERAKALVEAALGDPKVGTYRAALLEHRFEVRKAIKDPLAIEDLKAAVAACDSAKYKAALTRRLSELNAE